MSVQAVLLEAMTLGYNSRSDASMPGNNAQHQLHSLQQNEPRGESAGENSMPLGTVEGTVISWFVLCCSVMADHDVSTAQAVCGMKPCQACFCHILWLGNFAVSWSPRVCQCVNSYRAVTGDGGDCTMITCQVHLRRWSFLCGRGV